MLDRSFAASMLPSHGGDVPASDPRRAEVDAAIEGIVGMIRFGTGTSPLLYEALGDLLTARGDLSLAARAYLRAEEFGHPRPARIGESFASNVHQIHENDDPAEFRAAFEADKADAATWVAAFQAFEDDLARRGADVSDDSLYAEFYAAHGDPRDPPPPAAADLLPRGPGLRRLALVLAFVVPAVVVLAALRRLLTRRHRRPGAFAR